MSYARKSPRRPCGKVGSTRSVTRLRAVLTAVAERVNATLTTAADHLVRLGADAEFVRRFASQYGKTIAKVPTELTGRPSWADCHKVIPGYVTGEYLGRDLEAA